MDRPRAGTALARDSPAGHPDDRRIRAAVLPLVSHAGSAGAAFPSMRPLSPLTLEIIVLITGLYLLLAESFSKAEKKEWIAQTGIFLLGWVFCFSFFTTGNPDPVPATG